MSKNVVVIIYLNKLFSIPLLSFTAIIDAQEHNSTIRRIQTQNSLSADKNEIGNRYHKQGISSTLLIQAFQYRYSVKNI